MKPYARVLSNHIGNDGIVGDVAKGWGVPRWVIDDGLREKTDAPSARYLPKVARGLGMTVDELLQAIEEPRTEAAAAR
ncbi:MAG: hypothetical protein IIC87_06835 [Chloroflexi bacterium]|nr:hypothetical protein [Chloroflexota bacterium]